MKRHPLIAFLALAVLFSWALWIPMMVAARGVNKNSPLLPLLEIWGWFGPGLAAVMVTWNVSGGGGLRKLFGRFLVWRVRFVWYLVALLLSPAISLLTTVLHTMFGGDAPDFADLPIRNSVLWTAPTDYRLWAVVGSLVLQLFVGEELGWRGFVLPRLQQRFDALVSSMILAAFWVLWFLPLTFGEGSPRGVWTLLSLFLGGIPGSILLTWIFNNTHGSLLVIVLFNTSVKVTGLFLAPAAAPAFIALAPYWGLAIALVAMAGAQRLSREPLHDNCREDAQGPAQPVPAPAV
jgi:membrane protease YdiL (CAAX protease family)